MTNMTRRGFLELSIKLAAMMGLGSSAVPRIAEALDGFASGTLPALWLQGLSCSGCSVSLMNSDNPGPLRILTRYISLNFHSTLSTATGARGIEIINRRIEEGKYCLIVEGSVPKRMPGACKIGGEPFTDQLLRAAASAESVIAAGTCAASGGIPGAENNPTGAVSVSAFLKEKGVSTPVIRIPGCPVHPDWLIGVLVHALKFGVPPLDDQSRPEMFFKRLMHDQCPRFADYERERFAKTFSEEGCYFKLGCLGPLTHADCSIRLWNNGTNFCINAGSPCIGCAAEDFPQAASFPMFTKKPEREFNKKG
ncbi:MAG: hydrogenase small subunit [Thermodesulfobacteriota bacterium]